MPTAPALMFRGELPTTTGTQYTVPGTSSIVTDITLCNTTSTDATVTLNLDGVAILSGYTVAGNDVVDVSIKQFLGSGKTITGLASAAGVKAHISGVENT